MGLFASIAGTALGIGASSIFGRKGKKAKAPPKPSLGEYGQWAQDKLYSTTQRGLAGGGLIPPGMRARGYARMRGGLTKAYGEAKPMLASFLNRMVPRADLKVRGYADEMLKRDYYGGMQELRDEQKLEPYGEQLESMGMASELLAGEKQMSAGVMDIWNQQQQGLSQMPTFGSQLGYGLGSAGGILAAQRYAQIMNAKGVG